jgi:hypothetical protein
MIIQDQIDDLFHTYLIDPKTSLFGYSVPSLVKGAKMWYLRIRQVEKGALHRTELAHNASARRITYQIGAAIKFATQENGLRVVNNRLGKSHTPVFGFTKADERVKVLSASEIFVSPFHASQSYC